MRVFNNFPFCSLNLMLLVYKQNFAKNTDKTNKDKQACHRKLSKL